MGLAVERLPLTLHWKKLYISGRSNDNDNLLGKRVQGESRTKLLGFCRTAAAFMKLIMAAHTSWHSSEAASGDHWCKSRAETKLVWSLTRRSPMTGVAKTKQGEERYQPFPLLTY